MKVAFSWSTLPAVVICVVILAVAVAIGDRIHQDRVQRDDRRAAVADSLFIQCHSLNGLRADIKDFIVTQVRKGDSQLGQLSYYKNNPGELAKAHAANAAAIKATEQKFAAKPCGPISSVR